MWLVLFTFVNDNQSSFPSLSHLFPIRIRVGIATGGPIIAGIIGDERLQFDIWGNTVNLASRMESNSKPGKVMISEETYENIKDDFEFEENVEIEIKGIGPVNTYILKGSKDEEERKKELESILFKDVEISVKKEKEKKKKLDD